MPYLGTARWVFNLIPSLGASWRAWETREVANQTAGYIASSGKFSFISIRNAGHLVPQGSPQQAFYVLEKLIEK